MKDSHLIITANQRLSDHLQLNDGGDDKTILALHEWAKQLLNANTRSQLLTDFEEQWLWYTVVNQDDHVLLQDAWSAASLCQKTAKLIDEHLPQEQTIHPNNLETRLYREWQQQFDEFCFNNKLIPPSKWYRTLLALPEQALPHAQQITFAGFTNQPYQLNLLINKLKKSNKVTYLTNCSFNKKSRITACESPEQELKMIVQWCQKQLSKTDVQIACVFPNLNLALERKRIWQAFNQAIPQARLNIAYGTPITQLPLIQPLFQLLACLNTQLLHFKDIQPLLLSSFLSQSMDERVAAAELEQFLAKQCGSTLSKATFTQLINAFYQDKANLPKPAWLDFFQADVAWQEVIQWFLTIHCEANQPILDTLGQLLEAFNASQLILSTSDQLVAFKYFCQQHTYQPTPSKRANVHILGPLEACGLKFDYTWVAGNEVDNWPRPLQPNPLIPLAVQKHYKLPQTVPEQELAYATRLLSQLSQTANSVIFSYAKQKDDQPCMPTPILNELLPSRESESITLTTNRLKPLSLELYPDSQGPVYTEPLLKGGTGFLTAQAECPFKAFALFRLRVKPLTPFSTGLTAMERGNIVHNALERIWKQLKTHQALLSQNDEELTQRVRTTIQTLLHSPCYRRLTANQRQLEQRVLTRLLIAWLNHEKNRDPFYINSTEEKVTLQIANLTLNVRIDRIDTLEDGSNIVIDYKTGSQQRVMDWFGKNDVLAPQLPLYAAFLNKNISGIAYAEVKANKMAFKGVATHGKLLSGLKPIKKINCYPAPGSWQVTLEFWQQAVKNLVATIQSGHAAVKPANAQVCQYCDLKLACRISQPVETKDQP